MNEVGRVVSLDGPWSSPQSGTASEAIETNEDLLNVRIQSARKKLREAKLANRSASHNYKMLLAKTRLKLKAGEMGKPVASEDISARLQELHDEEPLLSVYLAHQTAMAEKEVKEDDVDNLKDELDMVKYNYFNPMQGMRRG